VGKKAKEKTDEILGLEQPVEKMERNRVELGTIPDSPSGKSKRATVQSKRDML